MPEFQPFSDFAHQQQRPDLRRRASMVTFLSQHPIRVEMFGAPHYANLVKLRNLNIPAALENNAYALVFAEYDPVFAEIDHLFTAFEGAHGSGIEQVGRSGGWLELSFPLSDSGLVFGRNVDSSHAFEDWSIDEIRALTRLVMAFDQACDQAVALFAGAVEIYEPEAETDTEAE